MGDVILKMKDIDKSFSGVQALNKAQLELRAGEVLALMGENGAGKSTLMKILTGIYTKDGGSVVYRGQEVNFKGPAESEAAGIAIVHQELNMMNDLTVAQNLFIGHERRTGILIDDAAMIEEAKDYFRRLNIEIDPSVKIGSLTVGRQQMVEIAKAVSTDAAIIIFDEPTAALTDAEIDELFKVIRDLRAKQHGIIYISHRMDEINVIADRVTVMRDGAYVGTLDAAKCSKDDIIKMMVGRTVFTAPKTQAAVKKDAPVVLSCEGLCGKGVKNVSFKLRKGEILGFAGLMGAGRTETARLLFGADKKTAGDIFVNGKPVTIRSPKEGVRSGIGYLSEDRKRFGLVVEETVEENTVLASLEKFTSGLRVNRKETREITQKYVTELKTKTPSTEQTVRKLSGGNQQKVVIAKWLVRDCDILIFDEPTRGIDVGAKSEIYQLMEKLAQEGKAIIMISSELPEILRMSDRVIVMCEGRVTAEIPIEQASQEAIMAAATDREKD